MNKDIKRKISFSGKLEIKRDDGSDSRTIRGLAIVFNQLTTLWEDDKHVYREEILPEAVPETLLSGSDILMTMHHNPEKVLARSKYGSGNLTYTRTEEGVYFEFEAPETPDGDTALALVRNGVIDGCSFWAWLREDQQDTIHTEEEGRKVVTYRIKGFETIKDFTLTPTPQYTQTEVENVIRGFGGFLPEVEEEEVKDYTQAWEAIERAAE